MSRILIYSIFCRLSLFLSFVLTSIVLKNNLLLFSLCSAVTFVLALRLLPIVLGNPFVESTNVLFRATEMVGLIPVILCCIYLFYIGQYRVMLIVLSFFSFVCFKGDLCKAIIDFDESEINV